MGAETGMEQHASGMAGKAPRRACDCCRKRKVKCDAAEPCGPCKKAAIRCAYLQPPKKKGPKGLRSARVLHALRKIDDSATASPTSPLSPQQQGTFGNWAWDGHEGATETSLYAHQQPEVAPTAHYYGPETSLPVSHSSYPATTYESHVSQVAATHTGQYPGEPGSWAQHTDPYVTGTSTSNFTNGNLTGTSASLLHRLPAECYLPYMQLFYAHMFQIMPVIDRTVFLDPAFYSDSSVFTSEIYCFLNAISAATIVQLDASIPQPPPLHPSRPTDDLFAEECLRERQRFDYIEHPSTLAVMTSFFLFAYYGNHEKHVKAWHYLQECITFAEVLNMEDEDSYSRLDPVEAQWRRRLYWLLFITERAYAVQRKKQTRLHASVTLPAVFDSEDSWLLNGFVNLANLFSTVDDNFVRAWRGLRRQSLCNEAWLANTQKQLDTAALTLGDISETQQLDISVTREWLHVLAWQMGVSNGLIWGKGEGGMRLDYPIELAKKVVEITAGVGSQAINSHGIGIEQKLSDIAGCLADVLKCTAGDTSATFAEGKQYLNILLQQLSSMRGRESRYLQPLMSKMEGVIGYEIHAQPPPPQFDEANGLLSAFAPSTGPHLSGGPRLSFAESVGMLRTLSMSGGLGMPGLGPSAPTEDWRQRRPSGVVHDPDETEAGGLEKWVASGVMPA